MAVEWVLIIGIAIGITAGFLIARSMGGDSTRLKREYEEKLAESQHELASYRRQVTEHFQGTAELMQEMTENYKSVYQHLARGAEHLTEGGAKMISENSAERLVNDIQGELGAPEPLVNHKVATEEKESEVEELPDEQSEKPQEVTSEGEDEAAMEERLRTARQAGL